MSHANFIVLEGIDGAGKSTQVELLKAYLEAKSISTEYIHFPRLETEPFGALVATFLRGDFGPIDQVDPKLVALLYAEDRHDFAPTLTQWIDSGKCVIGDRYVYSNVAFQCAKCADQEEKTRLKKWIVDLEFEYFGIPRPSVSFFLDLQTTSAAQAMQHDLARADRGYLDGSKDIHEADIGFQDRVRSEYLELTKSTSDFHLVPCNDASGARFAPGLIHEKIVSFLNQHR